MFQAQSIHRQYFDRTKVQVSTLLSIKTGACPEDCKYCPQSSHYNLGLEKKSLLEIEKVGIEARAAKTEGCLTDSVWAQPGEVRKRHTLCAGNGAWVKALKWNLHDAGHVVN